MLYVLSFICGYSSVSHAGKKKIILLCNVLYIKEQKLLRRLRTCLAMALSFGIFPSHKLLVLKVTHCFLLHYICGFFCYLLVLDLINTNGEQEDKLDVLPY